MFKFGVDTLIWSESYSEKDLWVISKAKEVGFDAVDINIADPEAFPVDLVKKKISEVGIETVTSYGLPKDGNTISPDREIRERGVKLLKKVVDINIELGSKIIGGIPYASWGYVTGKPRTEQEWDWSIEAMRNVAAYAEERSDLTIAVECVNRFETHFLNIASDAVQYCKDVGTGNMSVHLDSFHMIREENSFREAVETCGKKYLGYVHVCESHRGIPGTGLVPWKEFFTAIRDVGYTGPMVIESFDPSFETINMVCAIWRKLAESGEELAVEGLKYLRTIASEVEMNT